MKMKFKVRRHDMTDLPDLVQIVNENFRDYGDFYYAYEFIPYTKESFNSKVAQRYPVLLVAEKQEIEGFITLYEAHWGNGIGVLSTKQSHVRKEVEDLLISRIEWEAKSGRITVNLTSGSPRVTSFQKRGYEIYGGLYHLTKELEDTSQMPKLDKRITLRSLIPSEEEALTRIVEIIAQRRHLHRNASGFLKEWKETDPFFTLDWIHIAEMNGQIVSVACTRRDHRHNKHFNEKRAIIGPIATVPEYRRKGIAKALMCRIINFFIKQHLEIATLKVLEDNIPALNLYKGLGFKIKHHWRFLRKHLQS